MLGTHARRARATIGALRNRSGAGARGHKPATPAPNADATPCSGGQDTARGMAGVVCASGTRTPPAASRAPGPRPSTHAPRTDVAARFAPQALPPAGGPHAHGFAHHPLFARPMLLPRALSGEARRYGRGEYPWIEFGQKTDKALETHETSPRAARRKRGWINKTGLAVASPRTKGQRFALADVRDLSCGPRHGMSEGGRTCTSHTNPSLTPAHAGVQV